MTKTYFNMGKNMHKDRSEIKYLHVPSGVSPIAEWLRQQDMNEETIRQTIGFQTYLRTNFPKEKYMGEAERVEQLLLTDGEKNGK